jgi:hypothetical protein
MKKLMFLSLLCVASVAAAAKPANCKESIRVTLGTMYYTTQAKFPEPEQQTFADLTKEKAPVAMCGVTYASDAEAGTFTAKGPLTSLLKSFTARSIPAGTLMLDNMLTARSDDASLSPVLYNTKTRLLTFKPAEGMLAVYTAGVKVDGGPIQPMYYNGKATPVKVPVAAKTVDVYFKVSGDTLAHWQRISLRLDQPSLTFYKEAAFPAK